MRFWSYNDTNPLDTWRQLSKSLLLLIEFLFSHSLTHVWALQEDEPARFWFHVKQRQRNTMKDWMQARDIGLRYEPSWINRDRSLQRWLMNSSYKYDFMYILAQARFTSHTSWLFGSFGFPFCFFNLPMKVALAWIVITMLVAETPPMMMMGIMCFLVNVFSCCWYFSCFGSHLTLLVSARNHPFLVQTFESKGWYDKSLFLI